MSNLAKPSSKDGVDLKALMLASPRLSIAVAESLTSGRLQAQIGAIPGASFFFSGGITAYTIEQKVRHLGVALQHAQEVKGVSPQIAAQMARGVCAMFNSDLGAGTTGFAEPMPEEGVETPHAYWAISHWHPDGAEIVREGYIEREGLSRVAMQEAVTMEVVHALLDYLRALRG